MRTYPLAISAMFLVTVVSSNAMAADVESLPTGEEGGQPIARQCLKDIGAFEDQLAEVGFGVLPPEGYGVSASPGFFDYGPTATPRQRIRALRDAAYVYAWGGDEKSCQRVLDTMRGIYEEHQKLVGTEVDDPEMRNAWRRAHLKQAQPVTEMERLMRADIVIGADIRNTKDEKLGEIEDIVIDPKNRTIAYVLASRGGFLGFGEKLIAIRWSDLRATQDHEIYVLDVSQAALESAPAVDRQNFEQTVNEDWRQRLDQFWAKATQR